MDFRIDPTHKILLFVSYLEVEFLKRSSQASRFIFRIWTLTHCECLYYIQSVEPNYILLELQWIIPIPKKNREPISSILRSVGFIAFSSTRPSIHPKLFTTKPSMGSKFLSVNPFLLFNISRPSSMSLKPWLIISITWRCWWSMVKNNYKDLSFWFPCQMRLLSALFIRRNYRWRCSWIHWLRCWRRESVWEKANWPLEFKLAIVFKMNLIKHSLRSGLQCLLNTLDMKKLWWSCPPLILNSFAFKVDFIEVIINHLFLWILFSSSKFESLCIHSDHKFMVLWSDSIIIREYSAFYLLLLIA